jgi:hypothetical protein
VKSGGAKRLHLVASEIRLGLLHSSQTVYKKVGIRNPGQTLERRCILPSIRSDARRMGCLESGSARRQKCHEGVGMNETKRSMINMC